jgi:hypothetical protein
MTNRGGVFDKIGNWFEEASVVLQFVRILRNEAESVTWEPPNVSGIDYDLVEHGKRIAVQCKTRARGTWEPSDLAPILAHARTRIDAGANSYRFVTDLKPGDLDAAVIEARRGLEPEEWLKSTPKEREYREKLIRHLGLEPTNEDDVRRALGYLARIDIRTTCQDDLTDRTWELAGALVDDQRETLLLRLIALAKRKESLGRAWTAPALTHAVQEAHGGPTLSWNGSSSNSAAWLDTRVREFLDRITASRRRRPQYPRQEATAVLETCQSDTHQGVILVHGAAGSGKSEVIAQVVEGLHARGMAVLPLRADAPGDPAVGEDPIQRFCGLLGDGHGYVVVDQLDQVASAAQSLGIKTLERWVRSAVQSGLTVIVGCRSVDALQDTQLHQVLYHMGKSPHMVGIEPLPERTIMDQLAAVGVPLDDLGPELRRLVGNPMVLGLVIDLVQKRGAWRGASSVYAVVDAWCLEIAREFGASAIETLDAITAAMERDGLIAVDVTQLTPAQRLTSNQLIDAGILIREGNGNRIRIFHQTIADARLAWAWGQVRTGQELLEKLGEKSMQGFREARRLRLCIPRFADRDAVGIAIIQAIAFNLQVRPLLKRALLLGLADVADVRPSLRNLLISWLNEPLRREPILRTVVWNRVEWMDALDDWLDVAWTAWSEPDQALIIDLCASVSMRRGDAVAKHLSRWEKETPGALKRAGFAFWHDPSQDSDALFLLRLDQMANGTERDYFPEWPKLLEQHPRRVVALLRVLLKKLPADALTTYDPPQWLHNWPDVLPKSALDVDITTWEELLPWWNQVQIDHLWSVPVREGLLTDGLLMHVVNILSQAFAAALSRGDVGWGDVTGRLASPLREMDGWLLLKIGSRLDTSSAPDDIFDDAAAWFMSDEQWAHLRVGHWGTELKYSLAREFLTTVSKRLSTVRFAEVETWLLHYRDPWTIEDERWRAREFKLPNRRGETAYLLLPALDRDRWSEAARSYVGHLAQKFDQHKDLLFRERSMSGGMIVSIVPDIAADRWNDASWIERLRKAPTSSDWRQMDRTTAGEYTRGTLESQLRGLAERNPTRYARLGQAFINAGNPPPNSSFSALIDALGRGGNSPGSPPPLDDEEFARLASHPAFLTKEECARDIANAVERRYEFPWSDTVIERLMEIGGGDGRDESEDKEHGFLQYRINDAACIALHALANLARSRPLLHVKLLDLAASLVHHPNRARQASAAKLAFFCVETAPERATQIAFSIAQDPLIAAEPDLHPWLLFVVGKDTLDPAIRLQAKELLLGLATHAEPSRVAEKGGIGVICLRTWEIIDHATCVAAVHDNPIARTALAKQVAHWLREADAPRWLRTYAIDLANDSDPAIANAILTAFWGKESGHLLDDTNFVIAMADSAAGKRDLHHLVDACDHRGSLVPLHQLVLTMAGTFAARADLTEMKWKERHQLEQIAGLLTRLYEEASRSARPDIATQALDAMDLLIESGLLASTQILQMVSANES